MNENKKYYISNMCITKEDLYNHFEGRDDYAEIKEKIKNMNNEEMQSIADNMTDSMMQNFWDAMQESFFKVTQK